MEFLLQPVRPGCCPPLPTPLAPAALSAWLLNVLSSHYQVSIQTRTFAHAASSSQSNLSVGYTSSHVSVHVACLGKFCWPSRAKSTTQQSQNTGTFIPLDSVCLSDWHLSAPDDDSA